MQLAVVVALTHQNLGLSELVEQMARAITEADVSSPGTRVPERVAAKAAMRCETMLRRLMDAQAIRGRDRDSLEPNDWFLLDPEQDLFNVDDLAACRDLIAEGFQFEFKPQDEPEFESAFAETVYNGAAIDWRYWVGQMPKLTVAQASRLMAGLDPDVFADLSAQPNSNDPVWPCAKAAKIQRLAEAGGTGEMPPGAWLDWAESRGIAVHEGFRIAVHDAAREDAAGGDSQTGDEAKNLEPSPPQDQKSDESATVAPGSAAGPTWQLHKPERDDGLAGLVFQVLKAAHDAGGEKPNAREVLTEFEKSAPRGILKVLPDGCDYLDGNGNPKSISLTLLRKRIDRMTSPARRPVSPG
jgi:hypothetical protein